MLRLGIVLLLSATISAAPTAEVIAAREVGMQRLVNTLVATLQDLDDMTLSLSDLMTEDGTFSIGGIGSCAHAHHSSPRTRRHRSTLSPR